MSARNSVFSRVAPEEDSGVYVQRFAVAYEYPVYFTRGAFDPANPVFADAIARLEPTHRHRFVVIIDDGVVAKRRRLGMEIAAYAAAWAECLELAAEPDTVAGGERCKNDPALVERLQRRLCDLGIDRHSYLVAIGGGALLDLVGYVAATSHRGVRLVRVPTTVLAQDDSGVGVKNGVNAFAVKNFVGTFSPPFAVVNDLDFLDTLSARDRVAGMAEAVKAGLIRDAAFLAWIESSVEALRAFQPGALEQLVRRCAELHMRHIATSGDPFEQGSARPLDYGHWAAHKLEILTGHALRHGEAVAIGMALDARYAVQTGLLPAGEEERICRLLETLGFRLWHPTMEHTGPDGAPVLLSGLREFREHLGGELTVTLLERLGHGVEVHEIDETEMMRSVAWLKDRDAAR
jgi:3-dehydroquinate synthase